MLSDGILDDEEIEFINKEAKRLHLNDDEVERLIDRAIKERELKEDVSKLPLHKIAQKPETAIAHYQLLLSQIKMLNIMTDNVKFEEIAIGKKRMTTADFAIWTKIHVLNIDDKTAN